MIKFDHSVIKQAKALFPDNIMLHDTMRAGDGTKVLNFLHMKLGFTMDEDDVIRAFRNKKEFRVLEVAKRAKAIRDLYQQVFMAIETQNNKKAEENGYGDCI